MKKILHGLNIRADIVRTETNGTVAKYYLKLRPNETVAHIEGRAVELALGLKAFGRPIVRVISEEGLVVIECLVKPVEVVKFGEFEKYFADGSIFNYGKIPIVLGRTHSGEDLIVDLADMVHMIIGGSTGSGKSVLLHSIICSIIKAQSAKLVLIDTKQVELTQYENVKSLLYPVISTPEDALEVLDNLVIEMDERFERFNDTKVNNIVAFNDQGKEMPYLITLIDEFADLQRTYKKEFQNSVCALIQKSRACGIHIILSTQRPEVSVVTGLIKSNISTRIALKVVSNVDSRVILDKNGAEKLLSKGDAFLCSGKYDMTRFQSAYPTTEEVKKICDENRRKARSRFFDWFGG